MEENSIQKEYNEYYADCQLSELYHEQREAFLSGCHRLSMFVVIMGNSLIAISHDYFGEGVNFVFVLLSSIAAGISLVFNLAVAAQEHRFFRYRFAQLSSEFKDRNPTEEKLGYLIKEKTRLYAEEPPAYRALLYICTNQVDARSGATQKIKIPCFIRWTSNFSRWSSFDPDIEKQITHQSCEEKKPQHNDIPAP